MKHEATVMVGVDGSAASLHALDWAAAEARARGQALRIVCSYSVPSFTAASLDGGYAALDDTAILEGAKAVLLEAKERALVGGPLDVTATVATGDATGVLVEMSREVSLAVVGTRGRGGFADRLLGTVSSALPAHAYCPTVVVPLRGADGKPVAEDSPLPQVRPLRRVVVGIDGSPQADLALRRAIVEARAWEAELVAVAGVPVGAGAGILAWMPATIDHEQLLADATEGLNVVVDRALRDHPDVQVRRVVLDGTGAELLTEFSSASDLVVVGSRGRGGFAGLLLGSTSQAVLHHAQCPVMVVTNRCKDVDEPDASS
ncbi:universal stress protein [Cellulomonas timonensis]|uniref:universal stress protein n=1 Tax=Cellulomonas timonensis TaxID=1689271 RepID=UPI0008302D68|nr:universal stress protein [Cellulomonas timonensis]